MTYDPRRDQLPEYLVRPSWPGGPRPEPKSIRYQALEAAARIALNGLDARAVAVVSEAWRLEFGWYGSMDYLHTGAIERVEAARHGRHKLKLRHEAEGFLRAIDMLIAARAVLQEVVPSTPARTPDDNGPRPGGVVNPAARLPGAL